eukprot:6178614-Pleurochrysis_carterae.AAC.3
MQVAYGVRSRSRHSRTVPPNHTVIEICLQHKRSLRIVIVKTQLVELYNVQEYTASTGFY